MKMLGEVMGGRRWWFVKYILWQSTDQCTERKSTRRDCPAQEADLLLLINIYYVLMFGMFFYIRIFLSIFVFFVVFFRFPFLFRTSFINSVYFFFFFSFFFSLSLFPFVFLGVEPLRMELQGQQGPLPVSSREDPIGHGSGISHKIDTVRTGNEDWTYYKWTIAPNAIARRTWTWPFS